MSGTAEVENAVEKLTAPQVDELAGWPETLRVDIFVEDVDRRDFPKRRLRFAWKPAGRSTPIA